MLLFLKCLELTIFYFLLDVFSLFVSLLIQNSEKASLVILSDFHLLEVSFIPSRQSSSRINNLLLILDQSETRKNQL